MAKEQRRQGQPKKRKPIGLKQRTVPEEESKIRFPEITDLLHLEFSFDGMEVINVYDALPSQMDKFARMYANISNVDVDLWPVEERLDFVNKLWDFYQKLGLQFPLQIKALDPVVKSVEQSPNSHAV